MDSLPADLLPLVIERIILLYIPHPRKVTHDLPYILRLRLVCRAFDRELLHSLHKSLTLPNLPLTLVSRTICPDPCTCPDHCAELARIAFLASATYNSSLSFRNRLVGTPSIKRLKGYVEIAETIVSSASVFRARKVEITRFLCWKIAESEVGKPYRSRKKRSHGSSERDRLAVRYCIAALLGATALVCDMAGKGQRMRIPSSEVLGSPLRCAIEQGHLETVRALVDRGFGAFCVVTERDIKKGIELGNGAMVGILLKAWKMQWSGPTQESRRERPRERSLTPGLPHYNSFILAAVKTSNPQILQTVLASLHPAELGRLKQSKIPYAIDVTTVPPVFDQTIFHVQIKVQILYGPSAMELAESGEIAQILSEVGLSNIRAQGKVIPTKMISTKVPRPSGNLESLKKCLFGPRKRKEHANVNDTFTDTQRAPDIDTPISLEGMPGDVSSWLCRMPEY